MPLVDLWKSAPDQIRGKTVQQLLIFAGDGKLRDDNGTSHEFRQFLAHLPSDVLTLLANQCLSDAFPQSGLALQDIINQVGRRLGFRVQEGRYRGTQAAVGFDGLWATEDRHTILVEVKTTDAYRLSLETTATYRRKLIQAQAISEEESSILYVVGRSDTGDLEAQVRGSRHAWDIRIISVDALLRLLKIKEELERPDTIHRIRGILTPHEFTRVDGIIDLVFTATKEVKQEEGDVDLEGDAEADASEERTSTTVKFRDACIARLQGYLGESLVKQSYAIFAAPNETLCVMCAISKEYIRSNSSGYWFSFNPSQRDTLSSYAKSFVTFGCGSEDRILVFPLKLFVSWLPMLNTTESDERFYWHVHFTHSPSTFVLDTKREFESVDVSQYLI